MKKVTPDDLDIDKGYVWKGTAQIEPQDHTTERSETRDSFLDVGVKSEKL